jgi:signal transduction histidine kinase
MSTFRAEARSAINDTKGHAQFLRDLMSKPPANISGVDLGKRSMGMVNLISTEMSRLQLLVDLLHRLEIIRTGQLTTSLEGAQKKINVEDFLEDFLDELADEIIIDPTVKAEQYRDRLSMDVDDNLFVMAPRNALRNILRDVLRNALMYSEEGSPVKIRATSASSGRHIQFDIKDQGCGIRTKETERVFTPFQRGRQPQVIREHGYGLSLYLAKSEVEAMGGRMWFESEEGMGATFSFKLPAFRKETTS